MTRKPYKQRCTRRSDSGCRGFTVIELLITMAVTLLIAASVLSLALSGRRMYEVDQARTQVNRSLRGAGAFLVADIRQAGERVGDDFPALEIIDGTSGAPDELILRRSLLPTVFRVCSDTQDATEQIEVAWKVTHPSFPPPAGCAPLPDTDSDGWPDNIQEWKDYRVSRGGNIVAFIFNPVTRLGETFHYVSEVDGTDAFVFEREAGTGDWLNDYSLASQSRLYIVEERRYRLVDGILELIVNNDTTDPIRLVDRIVDFQTSVNRGGTIFNSLRSDDVGYGWTDISAVDVQIDAEAVYRQRTMKRSWSTSIVPRNVLSR